MTTAAGPPCPDTYQPCTSGMLTPPLTGSAMIGVGDIQTQKPAGGLTVLQQSVFVVQTSTWRMWCTPPRSTSHHGLVSTFVEATEPCENTPSVLPSTARQGSPPGRMLDCDVWRPRAAL